MTAILYEASRHPTISAEIHPDDHIFRFITDSGRSQPDARREYLVGGADAAKWLKQMIGMYRSTEETFDLLEFAAGYGRVSRHLSSVLPSARSVASDIHPQAVALLKRLGVEGHESSSVPETFFVDRKFDVIFALSFFTHMPRSTWTRWMQALLRHLKPDGCLIFTTHGVPGLKVMSASQATPISWGSDGFWFSPMSEQHDIDTSEYGSTATSFDFVRDQIEECGASLFHFQERGAGYQDVYVVRHRAEEDPRHSTSMTASNGTAPRRASPRAVDDPADCIFYHSMDIPGVGPVEGQWDLRGSEQDCLGGVPLAGTRVLEIGPASGYLTFWMEQQGAKVTSFDLDDTLNWDLVPFRGLDPKKEHADRRELIRRVNNAWWLTHRALNSSAECFYGAAYDVDESLGIFDTVTINSVLLHLRDPFLAVERAAARTRDRIVITEVCEDQFAFGRSMNGFENTLQFIPRAASQGPVDAWWHIPSTLLSEYLNILGFSSIETRRFRAKFQDGHSWNLYTIVGRR